MIINFSIQNYGPFREEVVLDFQADEKDAHLASHYIRELPMRGRVNGKKLKLLRLALIYGANASGKSSVLHGLSLIESLAINLPKDKEQKLAANPFAFQSAGNDDAHTVSAFKISFYRNRAIYNYELEVNKSEIVKEALSLQTTHGGQQLEVFTRSRQASNNFVVHYGDKTTQPTDTEKSFIQTSLQPNTTLLALVGKKGNVRIEPVLEAYAWFKDQLVSEILPDSSQIEDWAMSQLYKNQVDKNEVLRFEHLSGFEFNDLRFDNRPLTPDQQDMVKGAPQEIKEKLIELFSTQQTFTRYVRNDEIFELELEQESLGTKRFLALSVVLAKLCGGEQSRVLPIDEIEHSLHPDLLEHFLTLFLKDKGNSQLIATTHYRELLDKELLIRRDVIWFSNRDSKTLSADLYALTQIASQGFRSTSNIANFYRAGRLGAVPKFPLGNESDEPHTALGA